VLLRARDHRRKLTRACVRRVILLLRAGKKSDEQYEVAGTIELKLDPESKNKAVTRSGAGKSVYHEENNLSPKREGKKWNKGRVERRRNVGGEACTGGSPTRLGRKKKT